MQIFVIRTWRERHSPIDPVSLGFYVFTSKPHPILVLGPFQGKPACQTIALGRGVCGTAAQEKRTVRIQDVTKFEGHIACDAESRSEIVVPILLDGVVSTMFAKRPTRFCCDNGFLNY